MIEFSRTRIRHSKDIPVPADALVQEEGLPLVQVLIDGEEHAAVSGYVSPGGTPSNVFVGFSYSETMRPQTKAQVDEFTITSSNTQFTLVGEPIPGQIRVSNKATGASFSQATPAGADQYDIVGAVVSFAAADAGKTVSIQYRYVPSQMDLWFNDRLPFTFNTAPEMYGRIGVILSGEVFTDQFDASINWSTIDMSTQWLVADATGKVSVANRDTGTHIPAVITHVPNSNYPFLGLRLQ